MSSSFDDIGPITYCTENIDAIIDTLTVCLNSYKYEYSKKEEENIIILDKLGFNISGISEDLKLTLRDVFGDSEVMNFELTGKEELVTINAQHLEESLFTEDEQVEVELLMREADAFLKKVEDMHCLLQGKLDCAEASSKCMDEQSNEKIVKEMIFRRELEKKDHELNILQKITNDLERPLFSYEEIEALRTEDKKLQEEVAILEAKLAKYHNLPVDEKAGAQILIKIKEELEKVDNEIKMKLSDSF